MSTLRKLTLSKMPPRPWYSVCEQLETELTGNTKVGTTLISMLASFGLASVPGRLIETPVIALTSAAWTWFVGALSPPKQDCEEGQSSPPLLWPTSCLCDKEEMMSVLFYPMQIDRKGHTHRDRELDASFFMSGCVAPRQKPSHRPNVPHCPFMLMMLYAEHLCHMSTKVGL